MHNDLKICTPLSIPHDKKPSFEKNMETITRGTGRLFLFAGDQKIEHLNADFYGTGIPAECGQPEHLFAIASSSPIGAFATQLGMIERYGHDFADTAYIVKLNSKTNLIPTAQKDPISLAHTTVDNVVAFQKHSGLTIVGVGYTIYLGSEYEQDMITQARQLIWDAHQHGLLTVVWMYPRGKAVKDEKDANIVAGAAGIATALGADFVKLNPPESLRSRQSAELLVQAVRAAGNTAVICSGGSKIDAAAYLEQLHDQLHIGDTRGCAVGRNVHQAPLATAQQLCRAIAALVYENADLATAQALLTEDT